MFTVSKLLQEIDAQQLQFSKQFFRIFFQVFILLLLIIDFFDPKWLNKIIKLIEVFVF